MLAVQRCWHCGAGGANILEERDLDDTRRVRRVCMMCGREPRNDGGRNQAMVDSEQKRANGAKAQPGPRLDKHLTADPAEAAPPDPLAIAVFDYGQAAKTFVAVNAECQRVEARLAEIRPGRELALAALVTARAELDRLLAEQLPRAERVPGQRNSAVHVRPHWQRGYVSGLYNWLGGGVPDLPCPGVPAPKWAAYAVLVEAATEAEA